MFGEAEAVDGVEDPRNEEVRNTDDDDDDCDALFASPSPTASSFVCH
ncbi:hypothetical protein [Mycobacterium malmoense]|nr:hypothetical protein [Mycobacterium malmoense]